MKFQSARQAWDAVYRQRTPQGLIRVPGSTDRNSDDAAWYALEAGHIHAAIATLSPLHRAWGMRLCTYSFTDTDEKMLLQHAHEQYMRVRPGQLAKFSYGALVRYAKLVRLALDDALIREMSGKPKFTSPELSRQIDVPYPNWERDWHATFGFLLDQYLDLTAATLGPVARVIEALTESAGMLDNCPA